MDATATYTHNKGYNEYKSLTSGNSEQLGGIPHGTYGFAAKSIR